MGLLLLNLMEQQKSLRSPFTVVSDTVSSSRVITVQRRAVSQQKVPEKDVEVNQNQ